LAIQEAAQKNSNVTIYTSTSKLLILLKKCTYVLAVTIQIIRDY